ncbi:MAG: tetratricopeptide repeat protein [Candidatus Dadabacteria bacterium]|nr:MAG: tetratricopeptide repeat protein [Candidatus Dadabacteria bacterium]
MAFGWFRKRKTGAEGLAETGRKLARQGRWGEALSHLEAAAQAPDAPPGLEGEIRECRRALAALNLDEAEACLNAGDPERAREHLALVREFGLDEAELVARAQDLEARLGPRPEAEPRPQPRFASPCACGAPCASEPDPHEAVESGPDADLFEFYLDALEPSERAVLDGLGEAFRVGFVALQQGEADEARPWLERAEAEHPDAPGVQYAFGILHLLTGELEAAEDRIRRALEAAPDLAPAVHHLADGLRDGGRPERAAELLEAWLAEHPGDGAAWLRLGALRLDAGDPAAALEALDRAQAALPEDRPEPQLLRARALEATGRTDDALAALREVLARRPDLVEALVPMGRILLGKGGAHAERAAEVFKRCARVDPERGWWYLLRVAEAYHARGWNREAREVLDLAGGQLPDEAARTEWDRVAQALAV